MFIHLLCQFSSSRGFISFTNAFTGLVSFVLSCLLFPLSGWLWLVSTFIFSRYFGNGGLAGQMAWYGMMGRLSRLLPFLVRYFFLDGKEIT